jgi:long-subunit fatty acid transport protein
MKKIISAVGILGAFVLLFSVCGFAQFEEDALRLSFSGLSVGARSLGMGMAYTGVANDFSAVYWNPAGLGQLHMNEVTAGLSHLSYGNTGTLGATSFDGRTTQFGSGQSYTNSGTSLNSLGFVYSVPTERGSFVVALGYGRQSEFTTGLSFKGFNPRSSIIQSWAPDGGATDQAPSGNLAYELYLANVDSISPTDFRWDSRIIDSVTQSGKVLEGGGLNNISGAVAFEVAPDFFLGATLNILTGSYSYRRNYYEDDVNHIHEIIPFDFSSLSLLETVESDLSGFSAKLGALYKFGQNSRVGVTIKTPSWITVREDYLTSASSTFDNGDVLPVGGPYTSAGHDEYDVATPYVFAAGLSYGIQKLILAGDIEYTDWTEMEFRNTNSDRLLTLNTKIKDEFQSTANLRVGAEYEAVEGLMQVRGGFAYMPSPYVGDPSSYARKYVTAGVGFIAANTIAIDLGYAHGFWQNYRVNYDASSRTDEDVSTDNLIGTVSFRF